MCRPTADAGAFAEYEKARLVSKLRHARERIRHEKGKCEGRKPHVELRPEAVALAKRLNRASPKTGKRMSTRLVANTSVALTHRAPMAGVLSLARSVRSKPQIAVLR
jgi:hypothetical protein